MDLREIDAIGINPSDHWYYRTKSIPVRKYFAAIADRTASASRLDVVDIGAGSGVFSDDLARQCGGRIRNIVRIDLNYAAEASVSDGRIGGVIREQRSIPTSIEQSLILMMDVLEHVPDDRGLLRGVVESCRGTNHLFVTVPAFQWLWSGHDEFLGHYRRYSLHSLRGLVEGAGISVTRSYYLFAFILPGVWAVRRLSGRRRQGSDMKPVNRWVNELLATTGRWEAALCYANHLAGVTAVIEGDVSR